MRKTPQPKSKKSTGSLASFALRGAAVGLAIGIGGVLFPRDGTPFQAEHVLASTLGATIIFITRWLFSELAERSRALNYLTWSLATTMTFLIMTSPWWIHGVAPIQMLGLVIAGIVAGICFAFFADLAN